MHRLDHLLEPGPGRPVLPIHVGDATAIARFVGKSGNAHKPDTKTGRTKKKTLTNVSNYRFLIVLLSVFSIYINKVF